MSRGDEKAQVESGVTDLLISNGGSARGIPIALACPRHRKYRRQVPTVPLQSASSSSLALWAFPDQSKILNSFPNQ